MSIDPPDGHARTSVKFLFVLFGVAVASFFPFLALFLSEGRDLRATMVSTQSAVLNIWLYKDRCESTLSR